MNRVFRAVFFRRNILAGLPVIPALILTAGEWRPVWAPWLPWALAVLVCGLGVLVRGWAVGHCNYAQGAKKSLAHTGPYALVRNPLYYGNTLAILGGVLASRIAWLLPIALVWAFLIFHLTVLHEEERLVAKYGQAFEDYRARVPRWIPRFGRRGAGEDTGAPPLRSVLPAALSQCGGFLVLAPFIVKELNLFGLWTGA